MPDHKTSLQTQSPLADAQNSVNKAENASITAVSYPSATALRQAKQAVVKAERAVDQAAETDNQMAFQSTVGELNEVEQRIRQASCMVKGREE